MNTKSTVLLKHHLKQLKLPTMLAECKKIAARAAKDHLDHLAFLLQLCELELIDFKARPSINKPLLLGLAKDDYLDKRENILIVGPSGTGKSHLAISLAIAADSLGKKVRFWWVTELITTLLEAKKECHLLRVRGQIAKLDLLILDELGYVPPAPEAFQPCSLPPH